MQTVTSASMGFPGGANGKEPTCQCRRHKRCGFDPWVGKIPWRRKREPTPVFLPGKSHGLRSMAGYSPWGHKGSYTTESNLAVALEGERNRSILVVQRAQNFRVKERRVWWRQGGRNPFCWRWPNWREMLDKEGTR